MSRPSSLALGCLLGAVAALAATRSPVAQSLPNGAPCWEYSFGTALGFGDDSLSAPLALGFTFTPQGGSAATEIRVDSNGSAWLGGALYDIIPDETVTELLSADQRICVAWADLTCAGAAYDTWFQAFPASGTVPARAVVTWDCVEVGSDARVRAQLQLCADNTFSLAYVDLGEVSSTQRGMLIGISQGGGAADPGETDLSALTTTPSALGPTVYEHFLDPVAGSGDPRDLQGRTLLFTPNPVTGGWDVADAGCAPPPVAAVTPRGTGCPTPVPGDDGLYERWTGLPLEGYDLTPPFTVYYDWDAATRSYSVSFLGTTIFESGYANRVGTTYGWRSGTADDGISNPIAIGFPFPAWGDTYGQVEVNPNGYVYFGDGGSCTTEYTLWNASCFGGTRGVVAAAGSDLDDSWGATFPDGLYADSLPASGSLPQRFVVTWNNVPIWSLSAPSPERVTAQVGLYPDGDVYTTVMSNNVTRSQSIAFFRGTQIANPGETDYSTALPTTRSASVFAMKLTSEPARIGTTPHATAYDLDEGTLGTVLHVGTDQTSLDLSILGMAGCTGYTLTLAVILPMIPGPGSSATVPLGAIPADPSAVGVQLSLQAVSFVLGVNPLNLYTSNGVDLLVGL